MLQEPLAAIDAAAIPPFANEENKNLDKLIKAHEVRLQALINNYDDHLSRANAMQEHMKNVQQEIAHTQGICDARNREVNTEEHLKQLAEREKGRLIAEIKTCEKNIADITDQLNIVQNDIYRDAEKIDTERSELNFEKEELEEWIRVQTEKDEDNLALLKYTKEDEAKIKSLNLQIEKQLQEVNRRKNALSAEVTETQVSQVELDKTTEAFRALHLERQTLLLNWENAIGTMKDRDAHILDRRRRFEELRDEKRIKEASVNEKQNLLDTQIEGNETTEKQIQARDRAVSKFRLDYQNQQESMITFQDEVDVLRNTLNKTATELVDRKIEIGNLKSEVHQKQNKLVAEKTHREEIKAQLALASDNTKSLESKAEQLANMLKAEELRGKGLEHELKVLKEQQFKQSQEAFRMKQNEANLVAEVAGAEAAVKNLRSKVTKYDNEALKQQALLYNQDFQIQQLERKVRRGAERSDEEKEVLTKKLELLTTHLEDQTRKWNLLNAQLKKSQDDIRQAKRRLESLIKERDHVSQSIDELNMYNASAAAQLVTKVREKEELMVEENILRLELRKLRGFLNARADEVYSLENRQIQLGLALEERTREMEIHKEMLRIHVKNAEEERYSAASELRDRVSKVEKLKKRYEIIMTQFGSADDGNGSTDGTEPTQAYYVIKAAQKREELQREGDDLDAKIRKAEKEIKALENTLRLLNHRNEDYRQSLHRADMDSKDAQHRDTLEQQFRSAMEKYKGKRREISDLQEELAHLEKSLSGVLGNEQDRLRTVGQLEDRMAQMDKDLDQQQAKRERALKQAMKFSKDLRKESGFPTDATLPGEFDIQIKEAREIGSIVIDRIMEVSEKYPDMTAKISLLFSQAGLPLPERRSLARSGRRTSSKRNAVDGSRSGSSYGNSESDGSHVLSDRNSVSSSIGGGSLSGRSSRRSYVGGGGGGGPGSVHSASRYGGGSGSRPQSRTPLHKTNVDVTLPSSSKSAASATGFTGKAASASSNSASVAAMTPRSLNGATTASPARLKRVARPGSATSNSSHGSIPRLTVD